MSLSTYYITQVPADLARCYLRGRKVGDATALLDRLTPVDRDRLMPWYTQLPPRPDAPL
jgi:hypothetical protein